VEQHDYSNVLDHCHGFLRHCARSTNVRAGNRTVETKVKSRAVPVVLLDCLECSNGLTTLERNTVASSRIAGLLLAILGRAVPSAYRRRAEILAAFQRLLDRVVGPEYRDAHRNKRERKLRTQIATLENFGERDELEVQARLFGRLSSGLYYLTLLIVFGGIIGLLLCLGFAVILEQEILKLPVHNVPMPWSVRVVLPACVVGLVCLALFSFTSIGVQADTLSPKFRNRRIERLKKALGELGEDVGGID
jgi:hypothetical protein